MGSGELKTERKKLPQRIFALESQDEELLRHIKIVEQGHKEERTKFNEYIDKIQRSLPHVEMLLPLIDSFQKILKFLERVI